MVSKSVNERVADRKVNGFDLEMTPNGRFWGSKIENFRFFFWGPKWVWGWFGGGLGVVLCVCAP